MQRIIIPTHYVHTAARRCGPKETARPLSGAAIWMPAPGRASTPRLSVMGGGVRYLGYADETQPR